MAAGPVVSEFYERKRRLAYLFAVLSTALLFAQFYLGALFEVYSLPRAATGAEGIHILHRMRSAGEEEAGSRLIEINSAFETLRPPYRLPGAAGAAVPEKEGLTVFFWNRYSVIQGGNTVRNADLQQKWEVRDAVYDARTDQTWIFGWHEGKIVYRRRVLGNYSEAAPVAAADLLESDRNDLTASIEPGAGPLVAWREKGSSKVRTALWDGSGFVSRGEFDLGEAEHWATVLVRGRVVLLYFHRDDRSFRHLRFRVRCCPGCGNPPLPETLTFGEPLLLIGRKITGLTACIAGDRLLVVLTRWATVQCGAATLPDLQPAPESLALRPLGSEPVWRHVVAALSPLLMLFFSFSLVFLGFTLLRERGRFVLETLAPVPREGPLLAEILQRAMAYILDLILCFPVFFVGVEVLNFSPESSALDLSDPKFVAMALLWLGFRFVYHFTLEWATGRTLGKLIIGIRVVNADGSRLRFAGALLRNLVRVVDVDLPFLGVFVGTSVMAATPRRQRLGDLLARTIVIQERRPPTAAEQAAMEKINEIEERARRELEERHRRGRRPED